MLSTNDYEYQTPESGKISIPQRRRILPLVVATVAVGIIATGVYFWLSRTPEAPQTTAPVATATPPSATVAESASADAHVLPSLDDSDGFIRERFRELSGSPAITAWLSGTGLARNLAVVLDNTSRGLNPAKHLRRLAPTVTFRTIRQGNRLVLDPRNYQRYAPLADAAAAIDSDMAARLYVTLKPLLQVAYDELGNKEPVDAALERAMRVLLSAPVVEGEVGLEIGSEGTGYRFASPALESLPSVQKQLVRMGPSNERLIQARLRQFALAAGIAADRLPAAR